MRSFSNFFKVDTSGARHRRAEQGAATEGETRSVLLANVPSGEAVSKVSDIFALAVQFEKNYVQKSGCSL